MHICVCVCSCWKCTGLDKDSVACGRFFGWWTDCPVAAFRRPMRAIDGNRRSLMFFLNVFNWRGRQHITKQNHRIISHISSARFFMFFSADVFGVALWHDQIRSNTMSWCFVVLSRLASRCPRPSAADPVAFGCTLWLWGVDTISNTNEKHSNKSNKLRNSWKGICMHCMWLIYYIFCVFFSAGQLNPTKANHL